MTAARKSTAGTKRPPAAKKTTPAKRAAKKTATKRVQNKIEKLASSSTPESSSVVATPFYNQHEGLEGRMAGIYLDQVERNIAEDRRAAAEGREPDYEHAASGAGTPLVTPDQLAQPGVINGRVHDDDVTVTVDPFQTLPVDTTPDNG